MYLNAKTFNTICKALIDANYRQVTGSLGNANDNTMCATTVIANEIDPSQITISGEGGFVVCECGGHVPQEFWKQHDIPPELGNFVQYLNDMHYDFWHIRNILTEMYNAGIIQLDETS